MTEYWPLIVIASFAIVLYLAAIVWTEKLFPKKETRYPEQFERLVMLKAAQIVVAGKQMGLFEEPEGEPSGKTSRRRLSTASR